MVLDASLPDGPATQFVPRFPREVPILVYAEDDLTPEQTAELKQVCKSHLIRCVSNLERLAEETAVYLHRLDTAVPDEQRALINGGRQLDAGLAGARVMIIDDDVRNIFALTSVLERHQLDVRYAESGQQALDMLAADPHVDLVLTDIMMPNMDGYETIREIRRQEQFRQLPVIALTAKAMKGDRERCIEAGASDYITKPVNLDDLIWMLRAWLPRER